MSKLLKAGLLILFVLVVDQVFKVWIKTHLFLGEDIHVIGDWFIIHFTENYGMAFGMEFGGELGKLFLSIFRIIAIAGISYYLIKIARQNAPTGVVLSIALVIAGAIGNMIDSAFYGLFFSQSYPNSLAEFLPNGGGYSSFLHGKVVDMLYFPLIEGFIPQWVPWMGGDFFIFFRPVFNLADSAISLGVVIILIFYRDFFQYIDQKDEKTEIDNIQQSADNELDNPISELKVE